MCLVTSALKSCLKVLLPTTLWYGTVGMLVTLSKQMEYFYLYYVGGVCFLVYCFTVEVIPA